MHGNDLTSNRFAAAYPELPLPLRKFAKAVFPSKTEVEAAEAEGHTCALSRCQLDTIEGQQRLQWSAILTCDLHRRSSEEHDNGVTLALLKTRWAALLGTSAPAAVLGTSASAARGPKLGHGPGGRQGIPSGRLRSKTLACSTHPREIRHRPAEELAV